MSKPSLQLSIAGLALSTILQPLVTTGRSFDAGQDMRNMGKLVSLKLFVAVARLLSTCSKAVQPQPKSHMSPIEA